MRAKSKSCFVYQLLLPALIQLTYLSRNLCAIERIKLWKKKKIWDWNISDYLGKVSGRDASRDHWIKDLFQNKSSLFTIYNH